MRLHGGTLARFQRGRSDLLAVLYRRSTAVLPLFYRRSTGLFKQSHRVAAVKRYGMEIFWDAYRKFLNIYFIKFALTYYYHTCMCIGVHAHVHLVCAAKSLDGPNPYFAHNIIFIHFTWLAHIHTCTSTRTHTHTHTNTCKYVQTYTYIIMLCAKYGFGPSEDFAVQTSDLNFAQ